MQPNPLMADFVAEVADKGSDVRVAIAHPKVVSTFASPVIGPNDCRSASWPIAAPIGASITTRLKAAMEWTGELAAGCACRTVLASVAIPRVASRSHASSAVRKSPSFSQMHLDDDPPIAAGGARP